MVASQKGGILVFFPTPMMIPDRWRRRIYRRRPLVEGEFGNIRYF